MILLLFETTTLLQLPFKMDVVKTIFRVLFLFLCIIGNIYQVEQITENYFQYEAVTMTSVEYPEKFTVPAITFCNLEVEIINWDKLKATQPEIMSKLNLTSLSDEEIIDVIHKMNVFGKKDFQGSIFKDLDMKTRASLVYQFHELFGSCAIVEEDGTTIKVGNCSKFFDIQTFHFTYYVCHSFDMIIEDFTINYLDNNRAEIVPGLLYFFYLTEKTIDISSQALIMFNENNEYHRLGYFHPLSIFELDQLISLYYHEYANDLLEAPYVTNCFKYKKADFRMDGEEITNRGSCYEMCLRNKSYKLLGSDMSFPGIFKFEETIEKEPGHKLMTVYELFRNESLVNIRNKLSHECDEICISPKCKETFFIPSLQSSKKFPVPLILTYTMQFPKMKITCKPKLNLIVFLTNVFSTLGFWVGLSLFGIANIVSDVIRALIKLFRKTKIPRQIRSNQRKDKDVRITRNNDIKRYHQNLFDNRWKNINRYNHRIVNQIRIK